MGRYVIEAAAKVLPPSGADRAIAVPSEAGYFVALPMAPVAPEAELVLLTD